MTENELKDRMKLLYDKQQTCLKLQKLLIVLAVVIYKYGVIPMFFHAAVMIVGGGILSNKATALARQKYPYILLRVGINGKGGGWDPYIMDEARRLNDDLTVNILKFNWQTVLHFGAGMLGYCLMWMLWAALKR